MKHRRISSSRKSLAGLGFLDEKRTGSRLDTKTGSNLGALFLFGFFFWRTLKHADPWDTSLAHRIPPCNFMSLMNSIPRRFQDPFERRIVGATQVCAYPFWKEMETQTTRNAHITPYFRRAKFQFPPVVSDQYPRVGPAEDLGLDIADDLIRAMMKQ